MRLMADQGYFIKVVNGTKQFIHEDILNDKVSAGRVARHYAENLGTGTQSVVLLDKINLTYQEVKARDGKESKRVAVYENVNGKIKKR